MTDLHARTAAAFLADAAARCANTAPADQAACDAAIDAIEAGLVASGAIDGAPLPAAPLPAVSVRPVARLFIVRMRDGAGLTFTVRAAAVSADAALQAASRARPGCVALAATDCGPQA